MSHNEDMRLAIDRARESYKGEVSSVNKFIQAIHTDIVTEQLKYRKFNNYCRAPESPKKAISPQKWGSPTKMVVVSPKKR
jgi:hypothetical protein